MPAYTITTPRLNIRCWEPKDAPLLKEAVDVSIEHLRPWMPWAESEPQTVEEKVELLRLFRGKFDLGEDFIYGIFDREDGKVLGGTGLHKRLDEGALEIGYWVRGDRSNQGIVTESTAALVKVGFEVENLDRIEIHCDPKNGASSAIPAKLGFIHEVTLKGRRPFPGQPLRDMMIWTMFREDYKASPLSENDTIAAFDVIGNPLLTSH